MNCGRLVHGTALIATLAFGSRFAVAQVPENPAVDHARRVVQLLREEKFDDVAREFNAQVAAAMSAERLRQVWSTFTQQAGPFTSFIDQRVTTPAAGITAVVLGCRFEKTAVNVILAFDAAQKIAGLRFVPRPPPDEPPTPPPTSSHFQDEPVTVGTGE